VTKYKLRVNYSNNENSNGQRLQQLFQKGIILTKNSNKVGTNWPELDNSRATNRKIPFKMKKESNCQNQENESKNEGHYQPKQIWETKMEN
jgi:hypothetical protein